MSEKTDLQREILLSWYDNPNATNAEIADMCDCSASYVSQIKNRFDDYNQMEAMMDREDREMERMFGDNIFEAPQGAGGFGLSQGQAVTANSASQGQQKGIVEIYDELPNNAAGYLAKAFILVVLAYVLFETVRILVL